MKARIGVALVAALFLGAGLSVSSETTVWVESFTGDVAVYSADEGESSWVQVGSELRQGDGLLLGKEATAAVRFPDGARLDVSGPAHVKFRLLADYARTVELVSGTINRFIARDTPCGVITACDAFVSFTNGTVFVKAETWGEPLRVTVKNFEGENCAVGQGTRSWALGTEKPEVFLCSSCCPRPREVTYAAATPPSWPIIPLPPIHRREIYDDPFDDPEDSSYIGRKDH
jgi:hypothetical protein